MTHDAREGFDIVVCLRELIPRPAVNPISGKRVGRGGIESECSFLNARAERCFSRIFSRARNASCAESAPSIAHGNQGACRDNAITNETRA